MSTTRSDPQSPSWSTQRIDGNSVTIMREQKQLLRKFIRRQVRALPRCELERQSQQVWDRVFALPEYIAATTIGLFLSMPQHEIDTTPALLHALQHNKTIYVPQVGTNFERCDMELLRVPNKNDDNDNNSGKMDEKDYFWNTWPRNKWGIPEPPSNLIVEPAKPGELDLVIVPGLAFDRNGNRLGQGKGYYDRFIERITIATTLCIENNNKNNDHQQSKLDTTNPNQEIRRLPFLVAVGLTPQLMTDTPILLEKDRNESTSLDMDQSEKSHLEICPVTRIPVAGYDQTMDVVIVPNETIRVERTTT